MSVKYQVKSVTLCFVNKTQVLLLFPNTCISINFNQVLLSCIDIFFLWTTWINTGSTTTSRKFHYQNFTLKTYWSKKGTHGILRENQDGTCRKFIIGKRTLWKKHFYYGCLDQSVPDFFFLLIIIQYILFISEFNYLLIFLFLKHLSDFSVVDIKDCTI